MKGLGALGAAVLLMPQAGPAPTADREFLTSIRPVLEAHCFACHNPKKKKSDIDLTAARGEADLGRQGDTWLRVLAQLKGRAMPPDDAPSPLPDAARERLSAWLEAALDRIDERAPRDPGRPVLRRLNRTEYDNTIRDLVGIDVRAAEDFPADDVTEGFDNVGEALTLPPLLLEKYMDAADRILARAVVADGPVRLLEHRVAAATLPPAKDRPKGDVLDLRLEREVPLPVELPEAGRYEVRLTGRADDPPDGGTVVVVKLEGVDLGVVRVPTESGTYGAWLELPAGARRLSLRHSEPKAYAKGEKGPDTTLHLERVEVVGPERALSHRRIFAADGETEAAARTILAGFATRAFRRPAAKDEVDRLVALYAAARKEGRSHAQAVRRGLWAVLVSPQFLFRVEREGTEVDGWALASRLSYFLWSTMPDEALLAAQGRLRDPAVLRAQLKRMLADPRSASLVENFAGQWLGLRRLQHAEPDRELFAGFGEPLRQAMADEVRLFFAHLLREDRPVTDLLDADYTFLNERLARHYGIKDVKGDAMRRVALADGRRGGVATMAAVLTITSHPTRTSAVKRGKWILEELLGAPPPPPPPDVPELDQATQNRPDAASLSLRQRLELHRADPRCAGCHKAMDVLGLGLENYDAVGRWRDKEAGKPIDVAGTLPTGESFKDPAGLKRLLAARKDEFARTIVEKMLVYALGRPLERSDRREVKRIAALLRENGYRMSALLEGVVTSYPFLYRRPAEKTP
ncbi:MAG TPA: DUF1592 domain-containing protein [Planctomycetota bacterium]|nr:DUF1592 domain-containing protein [Planctomycetota bacterium]